MAKFIDDVIDHKESDIEKIQTKPNMYISYLGSRGSEHLTKEVINNCIDECINKNSPGREIYVFLDGITNTVTISDDGRGIPFEKMELVCTKLQAGSKFTREGSGGSAGENGTGLTAVNALSDSFEIISRRYEEQSEVKFEKGKLIAPQTKKKLKGKDKDSHGTTVIFTPSKFFMGIESDIRCDVIYEWIENISFTLPKEISIVFSASGKGKESTFTKKFKNTTGVVGYIKKLCAKATISPISCSDLMKIKEVIPVVELKDGKEVRYNKELERTLGLEFAFTYNSANSEPSISSFCNFVHTIDNGVHADAVRNGITQFLLRKTKDALTERERNSYEVTMTDVIRGFVMVVNVGTDMRPQFASQTKEKLSNEEFFKPLREMAFRTLRDYFNTDKKALEKIVGMIKTNAKARTNAEKVRNSIIKGQSSNLEDHLIKNVVLANNTGKNQYREIFLIEGDSAKGSARQGRFDNDTQALFAFKGVPKNSFEKSTTSVLDNAEFKALVRLLKCNIGERFDIDKLFYDKIIIMTDADIDGFRITSAICAFFLCHLRGIVEAGKLYKAVTPLYKINDKKKPFILNKREYVEIFEERIRNNYKVVSIGQGDQPMTSEQMSDFLLLNRTYLEELERAASHYAVNKNIIEFLAIYGESNMKLFNKTFPELVIEDGLLSGVYEDRYQILRMDKIFHKKISNIKKLIGMNESVFLEVYEKDKDKYKNLGVMTIGKFLTISHKYQPEIIMRYKGLGELQPEQLKQTTMSPENRILIQLTIDDLEKTLKTFKVLHGDNMSEEKCELLKGFHVSREDLDN